MKLLLGLALAFAIGFACSAFGVPSPAPPVIVGALLEAQHFGLPFAPAIAGVTIVTELVGSALILSGVYRWLGALGLAGFTLIATFVANRFWEIPQPDRFMVENAFFEHLGLVGAFLLVAWYDLQQKYSRQIGGAHGNPHARH